MGHKSKRRTPTPPAVDVLAAAVELARIGEAVGAVTVLGAPGPSHVTDCSERAASGKRGQDPFTGAGRLQSPQTLSPPALVDVALATTVHPYAVPFGANDRGGAA